MERGPVVVEDRARPKKPPMYRVVMLNDDYTPMEFVVWVLQVVFHKGTEEATRLMLDVHHKGKAVVAHGPRERCEFDVSRLHAHGLWATMQKDR